MMSCASTSEETASPGTSAIALNSRTRARRCTAENISRIERREVTEADDGGRAGLSETAVRDAARTCCPAMGRERTDSPVAAAPAKAAGAPTDAVPLASGRGDATTLRTRHMWNTAIAYAFSIRSRCLDLQMRAAQRSSLLPQHFEVPVVCHAFFLRPMPMCNSNGEGVADSRDQDASSHGPEPPVLLLLL